MNRYTMKAIFQPGLEPYVEPVVDSEGLWVGIEDVVKLKAHLKAANKGAETNAKINQSLVEQLNELKRQRDFLRDSNDSLCVELTAKKLRIEELEKRAEDLKGLNQDKITNHGAFADDE
jgi:hypothetical protein